MTDKELITTLRGRNGFGWTEDAADRIDELVKQQELLVAQRNAAWERDTYSFNAWKETEAKLAKAVGVLDKAKRYIEELEWLYAGPRVWPGDDYYTALVELDKQND